MNNEGQFNDFLKYDRENRMLEAQIKHDEFKRKMASKPRRKKGRKK